MYSYAIYITTILDGQCDNIETCNLVCCKSCIGRLEGTESMRLCYLQNDSVNATPHPLSFTSLYFARHCRGFITPLLLPAHYVQVCAMRILLHNPASDGSTQPGVCIVHTHTPTTSEWHFYQGIVMALACDYFMILDDFIVCLLEGISHIQLRTHEFP